MTPPPIGTWLYFLLWVLAFGAPVLGWLLAAGLSHLLLPSPGDKAMARGAVAAGHAALALLGVLALVRLVGAIGPGGGPMQWLDAATNQVLGANVIHWLPKHALLVFALGDAALFVFLTVLSGFAATYRKDAPIYRVPMGLALAPALFVAAVAVPAAGMGPYARTASDPVLLDLAAALPFLCLGLAIWTQASREPPPPPRRKPDAKPADAPKIDVPALWRAMGAIPEGGPLAELPARSEPAVGGPAARAWEAVGVQGPPPRALESVLAALGGGDGFLIPDLPDATERALVAALTLGAVRDRWLPVLVVTEDPAAVRDAVARALGGSWSCGPLAAGQNELRDRLADGRPPAAAFLDVRGLSSDGIRALSGTAWARGLGAVVLSRVDRGSPLQVTHRMFTLRRLWLALRAAGARCSVVATGFGGLGARSLVEQAFPGISVREVAFGPRATGAVRVWLARRGFVDAEGPPWARRALAPIAEAGLPVSVGDPTGAFDRASVDVWGGDVRFTRGPALSGAASATLLDEAWLVGTFRCLPNLLPEGPVHDALWSLASNPVTGFLADGDNLARLLETGQLRSPRPLVAYENKLLMRAHLKAALRDGPQDVPTLVDLFGAAIVEQALAGEPPERHVLRPRAGRAGLVRVPLAPTPTGGEEEDPVKSTVTGQVVRIVDRHSGRELVLEDKAVVATRFYPKRVFAAGDARYRVEMHRLDELRLVLPVEQVAADEPLTIARCRTEVLDPVIAEALHTVRDDALSFRTAIFEATVRESVLGLVDARGRTVTYDPVTSQYRTRVRGVFFTKDADRETRFHLARSLDAVLVTMLLASDGDVEVVPIDAGFFADLPAGVLAVDRHVGGIGAAEAMDDTLTAAALRWARQILQRCPCIEGCADCTPTEVLEYAPRKQAVLKLLS